jgi:short subunit dehydrogenase-like uncharacterized protein
MGDEVWILGGAGRSGRAIAAELRQRGVSPVLVGRDATRLAAAAAGGRTLVAGSAEAMAAEIRRRRPAVVINTVGPFTTTAAVLVTAGSHYIDLANDVPAVSAVLARDEELATAGRTAVTGAGFGVVATESVVVKLCAGRPAPARVRVDMIPSLAIEEGRVGDALAATIVDGPRGSRFRDGRLVPSRLAGEPTRLTLPDGAEVVTATMPLGELIAAQRASGAPSVVSASSEAPTSAVVRAILPLAVGLLAVPGMRAFARRRLAGVTLKARPRPREHSWGHARIAWADGTVREGWLRLGDAQIFTGAVPAEIAKRLLDGSGKPGAYTPAALFGPSLAEACGATYVL